MDGMFQWCPRVWALSALTSLGITGRVVSSTLHKPAQIDERRLSLILQIRSVCQEELSSSENLSSWISISEKRQRLLVLLVAGRKVGQTGG